MSPNVAKSNFESLLAQNLTRLAGVRQRLLLAVSGGRDSMALLHGVHAIRQQMDFAAIVVAHLNHGLRGEAGRADAEFVRATCLSLDLPIVVSECDPGELKRTSRGSLEEAARLERYRFLQLTAEQHELGSIVTAHHASDQAETVLHNILRGTGLRGLRGIPEQRRLGESVEIIRPMLTIMNDSIAEYVQQRRISFVTDATNNENQFTRNRIRNELLPKLQSEFNAQAPDALVRLAEQTQELLLSLDVIAEALLRDSILEQTPRLCRIDVRQMQQQPAPIIRHALTVLWQQQDWPRRDMNRDHWAGLSELMTATISAMDLPGGIRAVMRGHMLVLEQKPTGGSA